MTDKPYFYITEHQLWEYIIVEYFLGSTYSSFIF